MISYKEGKMLLLNKLNITNQLELNKAEEKISKQKAKQLFEYCERKFSFCAADVSRAVSQTYY